MFKITWVSVQLEPVDGDTSEGFFEFQPKVCQVLS